MTAAEKLTSAKCSGSMHWTGGWIRGCFDPHNGSGSYLAMYPIHSGVSSIYSDFIHCRTERGGEKAARGWGGSSCAGTSRPTILGDTLTLSKSTFLVASVGLPVGNTWEKRESYAAFVWMVMLCLQRAMPGVVRVATFCGDYFASNGCAPQKAPQSLKTKYFRHQSIRAGYTSLLIEKKSAPIFAFHQSIFTIFVHLCACVIYEDNGSLVTETVKSDSHWLRESTESQWCWLWRCQSWWLGS